MVVDLITALVSGLLAWSEAGASQKRLDRKLLYQEEKYKDLQEEREWLRSSSESRQVRDQELHDFHLQYLTDEIVNSAEREKHDRKRDALAFKREQDRADRELELYGRLVVELEGDE